MRAIILFFSVVLGWNAPASAQMFADIRECDAIYGSPVSPTGKTSDVRFYKQNGLSIKILFVEEKAAVITFTSLTSLKLPDELQLKLLNGSAGSNNWEEVEGEGAKTWSRSDGQAFAIYDNLSGELNVFSTDYIEKAKSEVHSAINQQ